jgi:tetratricopeptide (TPR) repeat protein
MNIDEMIADAKRLASRRDYDGAAVIAAKLTSEFPEELETWMLSAYIHDLKKEYESAISDYSKAIAIAPDEVHLWIDRGRSYLQLRRPEEAIHDFTETIRLCDYYNWDYYRMDAYFTRAEAYLMTGMVAEALQDLDHVRDDYTMWTTKLQTKQGLVAECLAKLRCPGKHGWRNK